MLLEIHECGVLNFRRLISSEQARTFKQRHLCTIFRYVPVPPPAGLVVGLGIRGSCAKS